MQCLLFVLVSLIPLSSFASPPPVSPTELSPLLVTPTGHVLPWAEQPFSGGQVSGPSWTDRGSRPENSLSTIPGLSFSTSGGPGQSRSVFLRGARAEDTLVLVDGMPVNDPLNPSRSFDFSQLLSSEVERVEVLKGPQSVLYGSDAMGGVVQFFTPDPSPVPHVLLEGGSYGTFRAAGSHHGFHASYEQSEGFSAADVRQGNQERDGHRSWNVGGKKRIPLGDSASLKVQGLFQQNKTDTDADGGPGGDRAGTYTRGSQLLFRTEASGITEAEVEWVSALSYFSRVRDDNTFAPAYYHGRQWRLDSRAQKTFGALTPVLGAEVSEEAGRSTDFTGRKRFRSGGVFTQVSAQLGRFHAVAGGRIDLHSEHERATTFRTGAGFWLVPSALRVKASLGSGFKAPSLYQAYSSFGSRELKASRILGADLGLEWKSPDATFSLAGFRNRYHDLIDFVSSPAPGRYRNVGRAETYGIEVATGYEGKYFSLNNAFTTTRAVDRVSGERLRRRPAFVNVTDLTYRPTAKWETSGLFRYVGPRIDTFPAFPYGPQKMPAFFVTGATVSYRLTPNLRAFFRGENVLNRHYQETSGFGTPGRSGYLGLEGYL